MPPVVDNMRPTRPITSRVLRLFLRNFRAQRLLRRPASAVQRPSAGALPTKPNGSRALASLSAFCAAWMVMMAARYFGLSAGDIEDGIGVGNDGGSWLATA